MLMKTRASSDLKRHSTSSDIRFTASAFRKLPSIYVFSYFPFGFECRIWDLIVSVPDHCLSFYFEENKGVKRRDMSTVECFKCHGFGHYARFCEAKDENAEVNAGNNVQENWD